MKYLIVALSVLTLNTANARSYTHQEMAEVSSNVDYPAAVISAKENLRRADACIHAKLAQKHDPLLCSKDRSFILSTSALKERIKALSATLVAEGRCVRGYSDGYTFTCTEWENQRWQCLESIGNGYQRTCTLWYDSNKPKPVCRASISNGYTRRCTSWSGDVYAF